MISKIFKKKKSSQGKNKIQQRIEKMNLSELRLYVKDKIEGFPLSEEGLNEVLKRLISKINNSRYYLDESDDDSKLKKTFDLVLELSKNRKVNFESVELIANFLSVYSGLIKNYDIKYKEIYQDRLNQAIENATTMVEAKVSLDNKKKLLDHY